MSCSWNRLPRPEFFAALLTACAIVGCGDGNDPSTDTDTTTGVDIKVAAPEARVVAEGLVNPCGIAVQADSQHIFVSMKERVVRLVPGETFEQSDEIVEFPTDQYGKGPVYDIGPLGLVFVDAETLAVGGGGNGDGEDIVRFYSIGSEPLTAENAVKAGDMKFSAGSIAAGDDSKKGEGNFFGIASNGSNLFVTCNGDDTKGWVSKVELKDDGPGSLTPFIRSKELTDTDAPGGATITPDGKLLVSQIGELNERPDSLLTFYDTETGELTQKLDSGLKDITAVAYSPTSKKLYGLEFCWSDTTQGGLYRLDIKGDQVTPVKITGLDKPSAMAFSASGALYITVLGTATDDKPAGKVLVVDGL